MAEIYLETERLVLREFTADDADLLFDLDSDPEVVRYLNGGRPADMSRVRDYLLPRFLSFYQPFPGFGYWAAIEKSSNEFIGWFLFRPFKNSAQEIELGYRFKRTAWGKGFATEGSRALVDRGFRSLGVRHVVATAMAGNKASQRVMEKAGLRFECDFIEHAFPDEPKDAVQYGLWVEDYLRTED